MIEEKRPLPLVHKLAICQEVARLVRAQLPLSGKLKQALKSASPELQAAGERIATDVEAGKSWSSFITQDGAPDSTTLAACIEAGESSGRLDHTLQCWSDMHIANARAAKRLRTAMLYPVMLIITLVISMGVVTWLLIPMYRETYEQFHQRMPRWLEVIVVVRENLALALLAITLAAALPSVIFLWMRRRVRRARRDKLARDLRLQALASEVAATMTAASLPLNQVVGVTARVSQLSEEEQRSALERLQSQQSIGGMAKEVSLLLCSAHTGVLNPQHLSEHLHEVAAHYNHSAELLDTAHVRWLPMLVALSVGVVTIVAYVLLIFLPWIWLLQKMGDPTTLSSL